MGSGEQAEAISKWRSGVDQVKYTVDFHTLRHTTNYKGHKHITILLSSKEERGVEKADV